MISGRLPITIVTAIVSPIARPRPSTIEPIIPEAAGRQHRQPDVSHRVAPSARADSRNAPGTACRTSREIAVIVGRIMIASSTPALIMLKPKIGPSTNIPQRP